MESQHTSRGWTTGRVQGRRRWAGLLVAVLVAGGLALLAPAPARAADVVVNSLADTMGVCTMRGTLCLREAITAAGSGGTITFSVTGTIILNRGTLVVSNPVTITGPGAALLIVNANGAVRVFSVPATGNSAMTGLTITGGASSNGGGLYVGGGTMTLTGVTVRGNTASGPAPNGNGGGIYVDTGSTLIVDSSTIGGPNPADANTAVGSSSPPVGGGNGGGIYLHYDASLIMRNGSVVRGNSARGGGGIAVSGPAISTGTSTAAIMGSTVAGNTAGDFGGGLSVAGPLTLDASTIGGQNATDTNTAANGGGIFVNGGSALRTIRNGSVVRGNRATSAGGGIYATGPTTITGSIVAGNTAGTKGGGIYTFYRPAIIVDSSTVGGPNAADANTATNGAGGGIYIDDTGPLTVRNGSVVRGNAASGNGGGFYTSGTTTVTDSTLSANTASFGGGIYNKAGGMLTVTGSTFAANAAAGGTSGGGLYNEGITTVANATISANRASFGGGIINTGTLTARNITVADNTATNEGGGLYQYGGTLDIGNALLTANTASSGFDYFRRASGGTVTSRGHNFIRFVTGNFDMQMTDILGNETVVLEPLTDNGGVTTLPDGTHTQTHALVAGSVPVNAGSNPLCASALVGNRDQRGFTRPQGGTCDIGAFEAPSDPTFAPAMYLVGTAGGPVTLMGTNLTANTTVTVGGATVAVLAASPDGTGLTVQVPAAAAGTVVPVTATNPGTMSATGTLMYTAPGAAPPPREVGMPVGVPQVQPPPRPVAPAMGMPAPPSGAGVRTPPAAAPTPLPAPVRR